jgi:hypothetical protein
MKSLALLTMVFLPGTAIAVGIYIKRLVTVTDVKVVILCYAVLRNDA